MCSRVPDGGKKNFLDALNNHILTLGLVLYRYDYVDSSNLLTLWIICA